MTVTYNTRDLIYCVMNSGFFSVGQLSLRILHRNFPDHPDIFVHGVDLEKAQIQTLSEIPRVHCENVEFKGFSGFPLIDAHCRQSEQVTYGRFHIWLHGLPDYNNVLYLDLDTIVLRSLHDLCTQAEFFIVRDIYIPLGGRNDAIVRNPRDVQLRQLLREDSIRLPECGANAGVFLVPKKYRTQAHANEILRLALRYKNHLRWADQSLLNIWLASVGIKPVEHVENNYQYSLVRPGPLPDKIRILHLNGMDNRVRWLVMRIAYHMRAVDVRLICVSLMCFVWNIVGDWISGHRARTDGRTI